MKKYIAIIAKFSYTAFNEFVLVKDVYEIDENNELKLFREHLWMEAIKIDKSKQGQFIVFYAKEYEYLNSELKIKKGLRIKKPKLIKYIKKSKFDIKNEKIA